MVGVFILEELNLGMVEQEVRAVAAFNNSGVEAIMWTSLGASYLELPLWGPSVVRADPCNSPGASDVAIREADATPIGVEQRAMLTAESQVKVQLGTPGLGDARVDELTGVRRSDLLCGHARQRSWHGCCARARS